MNLDHSGNNRRSIRLRNYDYSTPGFYYVTICVEGKRPILGRIEEDVVVLSKAGQIALQEWELLPHRFSAIGIDAFIVMPNHVHGIVQIEVPVAVGVAISGAGQAPPLRGIGARIRG